MIIVRAALPDEYGWLCERVGCHPTDQFRAWCATNETGATVGMIGVDVWLGNAAHMHFALDDSAAGVPLARIAFRWVFEHKEWVIGWLPASRADLFRKATRLGFKEMCRVPNGWGAGDDLVMLSLNKRDLTLRV